MIILTIFVIILIICNIFLFYYFNYNKKQINQNILTQNNNLQNNINDLSEKIINYKNNNYQLQNIISDISVNISEVKSLIDSSIYYKQDIQDLFLNLKDKILAETIYKLPVSSLNDSSLEQYNLAVFDDVQGLKTIIDDKFSFIDHVLSTYNSDIQRLTTYLNESKIDIAYLKTDINTFKLDSFNLHKLDVSIFRIETDIKDLNYKVNILNDLISTEDNIKEKEEDVLLKPNDIIMDISSLNLNEQYKEISKYVKKQLITERDDGSKTINFSSNKKL